MDEKQEIKAAKRGDKLALESLFKKNKDLIDYKTNAFSRAPVPPAAVRAEAYKLFMIAIRRYNEDSGIKFRTFLEANLRLNRFVTQNSSVVRLPENRVLELTRYKHTKSTMESIMGREPSPVEMADHLGWRLSQVEKMENSINRSIYSEAESTERKIPVIGDISSRYKDTVELLYFSMMPEQQLVWDYSNGSHGKPKLKIEEISKKMNMSTDKVYRILREIHQKVHGRL